MAGPSQQFEIAERPPPRQRVPEIVEAFASTGSYRAAGDALGIHHDSVRDIIKSPAGSFALEQLLRDRARTRALKLANLTDRTIDEFEVALTNGNERVLNSRRDGEPLTVFLRPDIKDLTGALAWMTHHLREVQESLSVVDVSNHDVSHEARSQNLQSLRELVSLEERRLALDAQRALAAPPGGALASPRGGDSGEHGLSSSAADAEAPLMQQHSMSAPDTAAPSRTRPPTPATTRETDQETSAGIRSSRESSNVTWEDLEDE